MLSFCLRYMKPSPPILSIFEHFMIELNVLQDGSLSIPPAILYSDARDVEEVSEVLSFFIVSM